MIMSVVAAGLFRQTYVADRTGSVLMPSTHETDRSRGARAVASRYRRYERPLSALVAAVVMLAFLAAYVTTSLLPAVVVAAVLVVVVRAPLLDVGGTVRVETDEPPEAVVDAFTGPKPPVLAFQWGIADAVSVGADAVTYEIGYLFGLRSVEMTVHARTDAADGERIVELEVAANGQPWSTYVVRISPGDGRTVVEYDYEADRRFGLRRVPQRLVAGRYRDAALAAQGYEVVERDDRYGV